MVHRSGRDSRRTPGSLIAGVLLAVAMLSISSRAEGWTIDSEEDYAAAFDEETAGLLGSLVATPDPARALAGYETLYEAYLSIWQRLFDGFSPHANSMPRWYADRLVEMGFGSLSTAAPAGVEFFREQLKSDEFDRVVHAYFILSHNALPLRTPAGASPLWGEMIEVAKRDAQNRYWISLSLAESRMLGPIDFRPHHTSHVSKFVTVRERVGDNAKQLGVQIHRVLGLGPIYGDDPNVANLFIRYAKEAATDRVRRHHLLAKGAEGGYQSIRDEFALMEQGAFRSKRLIEIMTEDLVELLEAFGLPEEPEKFLARLSSLVKERGGNRFKLRVAFDGIEERFEKRIAALRSPLPIQDETPPPSNEELLAKGEGAWPEVMAAFTREDRRAAARHFLEQDTVALLLEIAPPADPPALREALRASFESLGYDPAARAGYLRALSLLPVPESADAEAARQRRASLLARFEATASVADFRGSFEELRAAGERGALAAGDADPPLVDPYVDAATRVLDTELVRLEEATAEAKGARGRLADAAATIEAAELAAVEANRDIASANEGLLASEEAQGAAVAARNALVAELNAAVASYERARRAAINSDPSSEVAGVRDAAEQRVEALEAKLDADVRRYESEARAAAARGDEAEGRAVAARNRARREAAKALAAIADEESALEAERASAAEEQKTRLRIADVVDKLAIGLGFLGVHGEEESLGVSGAARGARLGAAVLVVDRVQRDGSLAQSGPALEREIAEGDPQIAALARIAVSLRATHELRESEAPASSREPPVP